MLVARPKVAIASSLVRISMALLMPASMLLQSSQKSSVKAPRKDKAYHVLKGVARKHHSLRMAAMAAMVQTATEGHFDVVIGSVDKMIAELRQEEQDDIDLRDYCQDEENKVEKEIQADIKQTETDIAATEDAMAEALSTRNSENE